MHVFSKTVEQKLCFTFYNLLLELFRKLILGFHISNAFLTRIGASIVYMSNVAECFVISLSPSLEQVSAVSIRDLNPTGIQIKVY